MAASASPAGPEGAPQRPTHSLRSRLPALTAYLGVLPFLAYVGVFLIYPTLIVVVGSFEDNAGRPSLDNLRVVTQGVYREAFVRTIELSAASAVIGMVLGSLLAWAVSTARPDGVLRRGVNSACGVLAQFGGVTLAFAFIATFGITGLVTQFLRDNLNIDIYSGGVWLYDIPGLIFIYSYFQIPLMVIVFLPALDGLRPQWREAAASLGGTPWHYWRHVAGPILAPSFLGSGLLLFANAFSAYATAAALVSQGNPIVPLEIRAFLTSEVVLGQENVGKALGCTMIVVVTVVMGLYGLLLRRASRWLR
ncbi:ABC transporter permease [Streptacidiphilus rugosus]|uniref:ABC transporter permease n=1 Tax=Streptacidiphilus rugosus TaxID=405783 RepID=UPI0007C7870B|nr:ABC transporter permease subunit [Streptacidiphilus rugosus]